MKQDESIGTSMKNAADRILSACKRTIAGYRPSCEQHIALFGESGSGKTTLLTVFYGYQQSVEFTKAAGYRLLAKDVTQGHTLLSSFYNLSDTVSSVPITRLSSQEYVFSLRPLEAKKEASRMVWHDYPGEWWTETKDVFEQEDKEKTFRNLMQSDVALFLVDAQKLKKKGDAYLKCLFCNFRDELSRLKEYPGIKKDFPLKHFPRVWLICLSKADFLPKMTAESFKQKVLKAAGSELEEVRKEIQEIIEIPELFYLGDDYLLLSAAQFDEKNEKVSDIDKRVGIDLIAPITFTVPIKRALAWVKAKGKILSTTGTALEGLRKLTTGWMKWLPLVGYYISLLDQFQKDRIENLNQIKMDAIKKGNFVNAILIAFEQKMHQVGLNKIYISRD